MRRIAAIDVGTNSVRSTIVEIDDAGSFRTLDDEKAYTRLGQAMDPETGLAEDAIERTYDALRRMLDIVRGFEVDEIRAVATAAVRQAPNAAAFLDRVREGLGLEIRVISQEEEGRLAFLGAAANFPLEGRAAVVDVGGGSAEIVRAAGRQIEFVTSLPIGAVVLTERFVTSDPVDHKSYRKLVKHVRRSLAEALGPGLDPVGTVVGSGGTVNALGAMLASATDPDFSSLQGFEITAADVVHTLARLRRSTTAERLEMPGLPSQRADIILAGAVVVSEVMRALGANRLWVNTKGIREGMLLDAAAEAGPEKPLDRMAAVREFGARCDWDEAHASNVEALALSLFDQLAEELELEPDTRPLLSAAALLHDVGYHIAYQRHHKHSFHLITYSDLPGFTRRELAVVAATARYHRGAPPKRRHEGMRGMTPEDRERTRQLSALLRLADGFDRTRTQQVARLVADVEDGTVRVRAEGTGDLSVDLHGAREKGELFARVFGLAVEVAPDGP